MEDAIRNNDGDLDSLHLNRADFDRVRRKQIELMHKMSKEQVCLFRVHTAKIQKIYALL